MVIYFGKQKQNNIVIISKQLEKNPTVETDVASTSSTDEPLEKERY